MDVQSNADGLLIQQVGLYHLLFILILMGIFLVPPVHTCLFRRLL